MNDLQKKIAIFPIKITKIFVRMSKMENFGHRVNKPLVLFFGLSSRAELPILLFLPIRSIAKWFSCCSNFWAASSSHCNQWIESPFDFLTGIAPTLFTSISIWKSKIYYKKCEYMKRGKNKSPNAILRIDSRICMSYKIPMKIVKFKVSFSNSHCIQIFDWIFFPEEGEMNLSTH